MKETRMQKTVLVLVDCRTAPDICSFTSDGELHIGIYGVWRGEQIRFLETATSYDSIEGVDVGQMGYCFYGERVAGHKVK